LWMLYIARIEFLVLIGSKCLLENKSLFLDHEG
jgi:hypothetical protein